MRIYNGEEHYGAEDSRRFCELMRYKSATVHTTPSMKEIPVDDPLSFASSLVLRGMVFQHPAQCEYRACVHKLLAPLLRISCIVANVCPRLLLGSFVQPIFELWGLRIGDLAVLFLLCARVGSEFVLRCNRAVTVSRVSVVDDRETYIECLTGTDDGDHP